MIYCSGTANLQISHLVFFFPSKRPRSLKPQKYGGVKLPATATCLVLIKLVSSRLPWWWFLKERRFLPYMQYTKSNPETGWECVWGYRSHLQFKDHVEHAIGAVGLQQLHDVGVFQHVADAGFSLQICQTEIRHELL